MQRQSVVPLGADLGWWFSLPRPARGHLTTVGTTGAEGLQLVR